jgi:hypothetical protein
MASDGTLSWLLGHTRRPAPVRQSVSVVQRKEGGRRCSDAVVMKDGGHRSSGRGGERCFEVVVVDHTTMVRMVL